MDKVIVRNVVARAVLDTRLQSFKAQVEMYGLDQIRVVCKFHKDLPRVVTALEAYRKEKLFKDINVYAVVAT